MIGSHLLQGIVKLASANFLAKALGALALPLLAKFYSPEQFGLWAACSSAVAFLVALLSLKLDLACFIERKQDLSRLISAQLTSALTLGIIIFVTGLVWKSLVVSNGTVKVLEYWAVLIIVSIVQSYVLVSNTILNVNGEFGSLSKYRLLQSFFFYSLCFGCISLSSVEPLILYCWAFSIVLCAAFLEFKFGLIRNRFKLVGPATLMAVYMRWSGFVTVKLPSTLLELGAVALFYSLVSTRHGLDILGIFFLTIKVMAAPVLFIATSMKEVFKKFIADKHRIKESLVRSYLFCSTASLIFGILLVGGMVFIINVGASFLPSKYNGVEQMVYVVAPLIFFQFLAAPMGFLPQILNMQAGDFFIQLLTFFAIFLLSIQAGISEIQLVKFYVSVCCTKYILEICYAIFCLKKYEGDL